MKSLYFALSHGMIRSDVSHFEFPEEPLDPRATEYYPGRNDIGLPAPAGPPVAENPVERDFRFAPIW